MQCSLAFLNCAMCACTITCIAHQYNIKHFVHLFVLSENYCCNPRINIIVIPHVITLLGLVVAYNYMPHPYQAEKGTTLDHTCILYCVCRPML